MEINQTTYESFKREVSGFYWKFNTEVLKWHMNKIFDYEYLLETAKDYSNFSEFYKFHTSQKQDIIEEHLKLMFVEATRKNLQPTEDLVRKCLIVRLGNVYTGMFIENRIITTFEELSPYIKCRKTEKEIDTLYKVDMIVELSGVDHLAIQIKPISFISYDKGSELQYHKRFELEFGPKVYYVLYLDRNTIKFNGQTIKLSDKNRIIEQIESILVYN